MPPSRRQLQRSWVPKIRVLPLRPLQPYLDFAAALRVRRESPSENYTRIDPDSKNMQNIFLDRALHWQQLHSTHRNLIFT